MFMYHRTFAVLLPLACCRNLQWYQCDPRGVNCRHPIRLELMSCHVVLLALSCAAGALLGRWRWRIALLDLELLCAALGAAVSASASLSV